MKTYLPFKIQKLETSHNSIDHFKVDANDKKGDENKCLKCFAGPFKRDDEKRIDVENDYGAITTYCFKCYIKVLDC